MKVQRDPRDEFAAALRTGDAGLAIEILLMEYGDYIYGYCRRILGNTAEAEDVSQTVFAQALQDLKHLASAHAAGAWLRGIARHRCLDHLRSRRRALVVSSHKDVGARVDDQLAILQGDSDPRIARALDDCLDRLDARSREVLVLRFHDELSFHEISKLTSDAPGTLRVRLSRALAALRRCLESKGVRP